MSLIRTKSACQISCFKDKEAHLSETSPASQPINKKSGNCLEHKNGLEDWH